LYLTSCADGVLANNIIQSGGHAILIDSGLRINCNGNTIEGTTNIGSIGIVVRQSSDILVEGNNVHNTQSYGIDVLSMTTGAVQDCLIAGNVLRDVQAGGDGVNDPAIIVWGELGYEAVRISVLDNRIHDSRDDLNTKITPAIWLNVDCDDAFVSGNLMTGLKDSIDGLVVTGSTGSYAIRNEGTGNTIKNNTAIRNDGTVVYEA
jgi:hypothetical protein